ncbi:hypothetical protein PVAG01_04067 [Phlyctema vagabunda]|uniref:GA4 desaturase family protein n=1 Tax=Phlyctema vagabunda TaxID=108571 RepID=A0ABR4PN84_9HELO
MAGYISRDFISEINYFPATGIPIPVESFRHPRLGVRGETTRAVTIHDVRTKEQMFDLDTNGFVFVKLPPKERSIENEEVIRRELYPEFEGLIKEMQVHTPLNHFTYLIVISYRTGTSLAFVFNHAFRQASGPDCKGKLDEKGRPMNTPAAHPHVDYSGVPEHIEESIKELIHLGVPDGIAKHFKTCSRFCFINAWRPLKPIKKDPLVLADATTVPGSDYQIRNRRFRSGIESANYVLSHGTSEEQHQWYYMFEMQPDEVVLFKNYDTKQDIPGWRCPHTAVTIPGTELLPPRESMEIRAVCFWN